jgi:N4-(beta-N-acetylglucosaminyl)-L-asparaginase
MQNRRKFIKKALTGGVTLGLLGIELNALVVENLSFEKSDEVPKAAIISTWSHGVAANEAAWRYISENGKALDAVEIGVKVAEADPNVSSVGLGGFPDANGQVTLDACIMDHQGNAGAVACLQHILHPISVARKVMEQTPHVMLTGDGALHFALQQGFEKTQLLTETARKAWLDWKNSGAHYAPMANWENHDTISTLALDSNGQLAGACTTSGMAFKYPGRVGDSPIIGAGLFVDGKVGAAAATGEGEAVMKTLGSFLVVEFMRQGYTPQMACEKAVERILSSINVHKNMQIGYIALDRLGNHGAFAMRPGFQFALRNERINSLEDAGYLLHAK